MLKTCGLCKQTKPLSDFATCRGNKDGKQHRCKPCGAAYYRNKKNRLTGEEAEMWRQKINEAARRYYHKNKELTARSRGLRKKRVCPKRILNDYEKAAVQMMYQIRRRMKRRNEQTDITEGWLVAEISKGFCVRSGEPFDLCKNGQINPRSPSVDRIDSSRGYYRDNCQMVCTWYNTAKGNKSDEQFLDFCRRIVRFNE